MSCLLTETTIDSIDICNGVQVVLNCLFLCRESHLSMFYHVKSMHFEFDPGKTALMLGRSENHTNCNENR